MAGNDSKFLAAAVSSGGVITWPSALAIGAHFGLSQATVQRVLARLVEAGALHRTTIVGERMGAWLTTPTTSAAFSRPAGTRFLGRGNSGATWSPGPTLRHDQLALIAVFGFVRAGDQLQNEPASPVYPAASAFPPTLATWTNIQPTNNTASTWRGVGISDSTVSVNGAGNVGVMAGGGEFFSNRAASPTGVYISANITVTITDNRYGGSSSTTFTIAGGE